VARTDPAKSVYFVSLIYCLGGRYDRQKDYDSVQSANQKMTKIECFNYRQYQVLPVTRYSRVPIDITSLTCCHRVSESTTRHDTTGTTGSTVAWSTLTTD
jgi:hypothetical protein